MAYSLQLYDFDNLTSGSISLQILTQEHVKELLIQADPDQEIIRMYQAGITAEKVLEQFSEEFQKPKQITSIYLAIVGPELKGLVCVRRNDMSPYGFTSPWWIDSIWVLKKYGRKGIGLTALNMICKHLQNLKSAEIWADINTRNTASVGLFKKAGFFKSFEEEGSGALFKKLSSEG